jgi:hypothetical protein
MAESLPDSDEMEIRKTLTHIYSQQRSCTKNKIEG